jgi:predicted kinase
MLIAFSGLPGTGKTTIARLLARRWPAVYVRVDAIEQALLRAGFPAPPGPEGYAVAYAVACENLRLGHRVVADGVNAVQVARTAWEGVARQCQVACLPVHLFCGDPSEHRRRLAERHADIPGHTLPTWEQVLALPFDPVGSDGLSIDTCACSAESAVDRILQRVG